MFRIVPVPESYLADVQSSFASKRSEQKPLWPWSRTTAYNLVKSAVHAARIMGLGHDLLQISYLIEIACAD